MLVNLVNIPKTEEEWEIFSYSHKEHHQQIRQAIQAQFGNNLNEYVLDPIPPSAISQWLQRNQQSHNDMNGVLGLQSSDLQDVDFTDPKQRQAWIYSHYLEHQSAALRLGI